MDGGLDLAASRRLARLAEEFHDKQYRDSYVASHTRGVLAQQMRNFRGDLPQAGYADKIGKQKTVIGRLENPGYAGWSVRTMLEIARKEDVAVFVRFVDFPTFLKYSGDMSDSALHPEKYDENKVDQLARNQGISEQQFSFLAPWSPDGILNTSNLEDAALATAPEWMRVIVISRDSQQITVSTKLLPPSPDTVVANVNRAYTVSGRAANV
jgi:hypothetical protein